VRFCTALAVLVLAGACASRHHTPSVAQRGIYKVGAPYTIDGITYVPMEEFQHVETGMASWYGPGFHGRYTANGEVYDQHDHTAAHRTLQMPAVLRVANLDNGQSTIVRVNDRGPYARARILDLSMAAAEELGMTHSGTARVRVEQLEMESQTMKQIALNGGGPNEQRTALNQFIAGRRGPPAVVATAQATPAPSTPALVAATNPRSPAVVPLEAAGSAGGSGAGVLGSATPTVASIATSVASPAPIPTPAAFVQPAGTYAGGFYVQTGAFSTAANAERQRGLVNSYGSTEISQASSAGREVYRVRLGPYTTSEAAGIVADRLKRSGYGDARVVAD
jgi:rare lipoprotein A